MIRLNRATSSALVRSLLTLISMFALEWKLPAEPMLYTGLVVTDVRVGTTFMHNASLKITFEGDTNDILTAPIPSNACDGIGYFLYLTKGVARMEIEFEGRTHTATLDDGQVFVAVDECNGGIGFGSFIDGLQVAYPLGFTLGTAEYTAIPPPNPLTTVVSTTGAAWSCIGYPPLGDDMLQPTRDGNCIPPDMYPLKSNIGEIFVYQPYFEYDDPSRPDIASNHYGSTNRGAFLVRPKTHSTLGTGGASRSAHASGVVYTLQTVADGSIGNHVFTQALVTFQIISDAKSVTSQPSPVDAMKPLFENRGGYASVTVDDGEEVINAEFASGEVYVRYDTGAGVAGFGSAISPTYPIALNCSDSAYPSDSNYAVDCLQGNAWNYLNTTNRLIYREGILAQLSSPDLPSAGVAALPQLLSRNTLLTGTAHTCAGVYRIGFSSLEDSFPGDLGKCGGPAPHGLHTTKGELFFQDLEGGSLSDGIRSGWVLANSGSLHVEVYRDDD